MEYMKAVPDPRCGRETKHDHAEVLVCLIIGFLAGRTTIRRSLKWCKKHLEELREYLPLKNGIASLSTACRILSGTDVELFALEFMEWIEKVKNFRAPMVLNAIDAATGLVLAQLPIQNKDCEIKAIPELLRLLDIQGSIVTTDAIGTQTRIMEQILSQEGHFVLMVKKNQPQSYDEIVKYFEEMSEDHKKMKEDKNYRPRYPQMQEKYEEVIQQERNRDRQEYRFYSVCTECGLLTKTQKEWPFVKTVGFSRQIRIPVERDEQGSDITPDTKTFLEKGSRRSPKPVQDEEMGRDLLKTGMISDMELGAEEMGRIKREHWSVENCLHHVLDDTFREDRSPAKKSKNNLALIRKFAYNILRIAMLTGDCSKIMTEAMDDFSDDPELRKKYVFNGINSFY